MSPQVLAFLWKKLKKSKGIRRYFWMLVLLFLGLGSGHGFPRLKAAVGKIAPGLQQYLAYLPGKDAPGTGSSGKLPEGAGPVKLTDDSPIQVYFTKPGAPPAENEYIARAVVAYVDRAKISIDVCAFELDNKIITEALVRAVKRGVQVRLVTETDYIKEYGVEALKAVGVPVVDDQRANAFMHDKFMVFDEQSVWTGSMNFTENCAYKNNNNGIFVDDPQIAANYSTKFRWMFEQHKFGNKPSAADRIPNPLVQLRDGTVVENYFSTHDKIGEHLIEKIAKAKKSIHFLAFSFTYDEMSKAMAARVQSGVPVLGVFEKSQSVGSHSEYTKMKAYGPPVEVYLDANPRNMHHKVLIIDDEVTVAGSFNFSKNAEKSNDENVLILHGPAVAAKFEEEFQRVFGAAKALEQSGGQMASAGKSNSSAKK